MLKIGAGDKRVGCFMSQWSHEPLTAVRQSCLARRTPALLIGVEECEELLARDHDTTAELDRGDRALVDARGDRAGIDPERLGRFFPGDDQAAPPAQVFHIESALPHHHTIRSSHAREGCIPR